jgi:uroporphyrinogen III methyltransferase/synthase
MTAPSLRLISRGSRLARVQVDEVLPQLAPLFPDATFTKQIVTTPGDRDLKIALTDPSVPEDFFTRDLDEAMRRGEADIGVHSAKDLPQHPVPGITVAALLPALDIRDALVVRRGLASDAIRVIGTSSPRREAEILRLHPGATLKPLRGTIEQRLALLDQGDYDAILVAACALIRLGLADRIDHHLPYDPSPQQGRLALTVRDDRPDLLRALRRLDVRRRAGLVALVGCPADPALLGRQAETYLREADVVLHDRLIPESIRGRLGSKAIAVGKAGGQASTPQSEIHRLMLHAAEKGQLVVRLHGGDPGIYGHLAEELDFLHAWNLRTDVVPAVTAMQVAAAHAGVPLTYRGEGHRVTLISARPTPGYDPGTLPAPSLGHLAVYMGVAEMEAVDRKLREAGWPADATVVVGERLGHVDERIRRATLGDWRGLDVRSPAVFLIGPKASPGPAATLFTGTDPDHFLKHGPLLHWPLIKLVALPLAERVAHLQRLRPAVRGVIFPSRFAVQSVVEALLAEGDVRSLAGLTLLAVGPATADELARHGLRADGAADNLYGVRALREKLGAEFAGRYLYPCSDAAPQQERQDALRGHGIELAPALFYRNVACPPPALPQRPFDRVLFTSSSTVRVYFDAYPQELQSARTWLAVGPSTAKALEERNLEPEIIES